MLRKMLYRQNQEIMKGDEIYMSKRKNLVASVLKTVANVSVESASFLGFYEPKMPEQLRKQNKTTNKNV